MREKTCCFCGHRIVVDEIKEKVRAAVIDLIENHGINNFYSGHMGEFDHLCERIVRGLSRRYTLRLSIVLPYMTSAVNKGELERLFDEIIIPDLGNVHYKRAITLRNQWMNIPTLFCATLIMILAARIGRNNMPQK